MYLDSGLKWLVTFCLMIPKVNLQFPMQIYQMPPIIAWGSPPSQPLRPTSTPCPPLPLLPSMSYQIALPIPIPVKPQTTTTTERNIGMAIPIQIPFPFPVAIPAQPPPDFCIKKPRPPNCPVCPPCTCNPCMPAFFAYCSSCHQKCRCRDREETPRVAPMSGLLPPPYMMPAPYSIPYRKKLRGGISYEKTDDNIMDDSDSSSAEWTPRHKRSRKRLMTRISGLVNRRRSLDISGDIGDDDFKPVLSYLTRDGAVKLEKVLSEDEAEDLLEENSVSQKVVVTAEEDAGKRQKLRVVSQNENNLPSGSTRTGHSNHRQRRVHLKPGLVQHMLAEGKKELVFSPPVDKKISNLSVSFQIS